MTENAKSMNGCDPAGAASEIVKKMTSVSHMVNSGQTANDIFQFLCWPDMATVSEGAPTVSRGTEAVVALVHEYLQGMGQNVVFEVKGPVTSSADLAYCLAQITARHEGKPDEVYRLLAIWQRRGGEWKMVQEMLGAGGF